MLIRIDGREVGKRVNQQVNQLLVLQHARRHYSSATSKHRSNVSNPRLPKDTASSSNHNVHSNEDNAGSWGLRRRLQQLTARVFPSIAVSPKTIPDTLTKHTDQQSAKENDPPAVDLANKKDAESLSIPDSPLSNRTPQLISARSKRASKKLQAKRRLRRKFERAKSREATINAKGKSKQKGVKEDLEVQDPVPQREIAEDSLRTHQDVKESAILQAPNVDQYTIKGEADTPSTKHEKVKLGDNERGSSKGTENIVKTLKQYPEQNRDSPPHASLDMKSTQKGSEEERKNKYAPVAPRQTFRAVDSNYNELIGGASISRYRQVIPAKVLDGLEKSTPGEYLRQDDVATFTDEKRRWWNEEGKWNWTIGGRMSALEIPLMKVQPLREMIVPQLAHGLDRVLFNPGVHWLRDTRSGIYNYEPKLRDIYDVDLFDYSALPPYVTSSKDEELAELARRNGKRYTGSTSSMTALLSQIYFLISAWKQPDMSNFSSGFASLTKTFSYGAKLPANVYLRRFEESLPNGEMMVRYAIDADKSAEGSENNNYVLTQLGKSVEKLLTSKPEEYEKYLRINSHLIGLEEREKREAYHYATSGKLLMRSQLDCSDERLPRKTFDLKTRAVIAVRQDRANWVESSGYLIRQATGIFESFEREMWDMTRAALLKYYFQARIGHMDGILVAYHSTATMFGFQYLPCEDLAMKLFGSIEMGEQAFRLTLGMLEKILDAVTDLMPMSTLKLTLDTESGRDPKMLTFVETVDLDKESIQGLPKEETNQEAKTEADQKLRKEDNQRNSLQLDIQVDRYLGKDLVRGPVDFSLPNGYRVNVATEDEITRRKRASLPPLNWSIEYSIAPRSDLTPGATEDNLMKIMKRKVGLAPLILPNLEALNERERQREMELSKNEIALQKFFEDRKSGIAIGMPAAPGQVSTGQFQTISADDGDGSAASADHEERQASEANVPNPKTQAWKSQTLAVERLRELARLGKQDKEREAETDLMQIYERRGD